jgi:hypothetical protein
MLMHVPAETGSPTQRRRRVGIHARREFMQNTSRLFLFSGVVVVAALLALEVAARLMRPESPWLNPRYVRLSEAYPDLDALIADADWGPGGVTRYYEEFLYAKQPSTSAHVTFTEYYSARLTPSSVPLGSAEHIVWTFGGSTMENSETTDSLTIANTWARHFNRALGPTHVKNFGTDSFFSSYELIKFQRLLREVPTSERPTMALFYDGYNDAVYGYQYGPGRMQGDLSFKLQALVERRHATLWAHTTSAVLGRWSRLWELTAGRVVDRALSPVTWRPGAANLDASPAIYESNVRMIEATCTAFGIRCFFILRPLLVTKTPLDPTEQEAFDTVLRHPRLDPEGVQFVRDFYTGAGELLRENAGFIDASQILDGDPRGHFYDIGHLGALSPPLVGERIADLVLARLDATGPTP